MLVAMIAAVLSAAPPQDARPPALTRAEDCVRENVAAAVSATDSAVDAADFLLSYLCAGPVSTAALYQMNVEVLAGLRGMSSGLRAPGAGAATEPDAVTLDLENSFNPFGAIDDARVDPENGRIVVDESGASGMLVNAIRAQTGSIAELVGDQKPVFLRELAGRLVLEARSR